jgi:membrane protease YdiL (CAAX protease family)
MITVDQPSESPPTDPETPAGLPEPSVAPREPGGRLMAAIEVLLCSGFPTQLGLIFVFATVGLQPTDSTGELSLAYIVLLSLTDAAILIALIFHFLRIHDEQPARVLLGGRPVGREVRFGLLLIPLIVIGTLGALAAISAFAPWLRNVPDNPLEALIRSPLNVALFILVAVVAGGLREEIQRAFILRRFEQHLGGGWLGLALFSIAFGFGHQIQGWDAAIVTGLLGALWGALYLVRGSAVAAMISHAGFNLVEIFLALAAGASVA